jgi:hypothetical protein
MELVPDGGGTSWKRRCVEMTLPAGVAEDEFLEHRWRGVAQRPIRQPLAVIFQAAVKQEVKIEQWVLNLQQEQSTASTGNGAAWERQQMAGAGFDLPNDAAVRAIVADTSPYAIKMQNAEALVHMLQSVHAVIEESTNKDVDVQDERYIQKWKEFCHACDTPWMRDDISANCGRDCDGRRREEYLQCLFVWWYYQQMMPKRSADPAPKPQSAVNALLGVRRYHKNKLHVEMASSKQVRMLLKGMQRRFIAEHGEDALQPQRKEPLTSTMIQKMHTKPNGGDLYKGAKLGSRVVDPEEHFWKCWDALIALMACTGFRKGEMMVTKGEWTKLHVSRSHVVWMVDGKYVYAPTAKQLQNLRVGDYVAIRPPLSKADAFGAVWCGRTIHLPWLPMEKSAINAARMLALMELSFPCEGMQMRKMTPLFTVLRDREAAFKQHHVEPLFDHVLLLIGVPMPQVKCYSFHSFRIFLACALYAKGASDSLIQAMLRWQSPQSLRLYARIGATQYGSVILDAMTADISSVQTNNLPTTEPDQFFYQMEKWLQELSDDGK